MRANALSSRVGEAQIQPPDDYFFLAAFFFVARFFDRFFAAFLP